MVASSNRAPPIPPPNAAIDGTILELLVDTESSDRVVHAYMYNVKYYPQKINYSILNFYVPCRVTIVMNLILL